VLVKRTYVTLLVVFILALVIIVTYMLLTRAPEKIEAPKTIQVSSTAFTNGSYIPKKYTCDGDNISPPISWSNIPSDAKSLVLLVVDPDAPFKPFIHWILYNIPVDVRELPENIPKEPIVENYGYQGVNDFGDIGYGGPCPPPGSTHRYIFRVYALNVVLDVKPGASIDEIKRHMDGHIIAYGELIGLYGR